MMPAQRLRLIFELQRIQKALATAEEDAKKRADEAVEEDQHTNRHAVEAGTLCARAEYAAEQIEAIIERLKTETKNAPAAVGIGTRASMADGD